MFLYKHRVNYSDTDVTGWIYYTKPLEWMEWCRTEFFRQICGSILELGKQMGVMTFPSSMNVNYHKPIYFDSEVDIEMSVTEIQHYSYKLAYEILCNGERAISAELQMVSASSQTNRLAPIPEAMRSLLQDHLQ